jgi:hypothetical protein
MNKEYHVWIQVNMTDQKYDVYVQSPDSVNPVKIAEGAAFRHSPVSALSYFNCMHNGDYLSNAHVEVLEIKVTDTIGIAPTSEDPPTGIQSQTQNTFELNNYPNPFITYTTIRYHLNESSDVSLKINTIDGKEIRTIVNEKQIMGDYEFIVERMDLYKGVYFYMLINGNHSITKKRLLTERIALC